MELRDVVALLGVLAGVVALKGMYDAFISLNLPPWFFYLLLAFVTSFAFVGLFVLLSKNAEQMAHLKFGIGKLTLMPKQAILSSARLWLSWPWWALMLLVWRVFEGSTEELAKALALSFGFSLETNIPFLGSPAVLFSVVMIYVCLVLMTAPVLVIYPGGTGAGVCPRCGTLHGPADNYCCHCGGSLPKKT